MKSDHAAPTGKDLKLRGGLPGNYAVYASMVPPSFLGWHNQLHRGEGG